MSKRIEELVASIKRETTHYADQDFYDVDIEELLKRFAIEMCTKQRKLCLEHSIVDTDEEYDRHDDVTTFISSINEDSILNSPLPEELH